ncbi:MAG: 3'(2'),5'-bisphosphate nucleotidase [Halobacteriovoraceae bacterium]|nr:3'(2'),5'-bisphosphate nucleotidase [Halobacteriovoraceae bacterium]|tara:strand:- start:93963 stop:94730 length:768 start_codon:yes stop_codon:yes gene_type:complete
MINELIEISKMAGKAIMEVYKKDDFEKQIKVDQSPVTAADFAANDVIISELKKKFPNIPAFSEESENITYEDRRNWKEYFLIDPLDGTKEFIKRNGEFTVNIALIRDGSPVLGVVYAPDKDLLYYNTDSTHAYKEVNGEKSELPIKQTDKDSFVMVASRSHMNKETKDFLEELQCKFENVELVNMGSSLKLCLVAEGVADSYPRLGPTSEWDTAAAHAVVKASGGEVLQYGTDQPLVYNKENVLNPNFEVTRPKL